MAAEGDFRWASGENVFYTNWRPGEPSNGGGIEDYGLLNGGTTFQWEDNSIFIRHFGLIEIDDAFV